MAELEGLIPDDIETTRRRREQYRRRFGDAAAREKFGAAEEAEAAAASFSETAARAVGVNDIVRRGMMVAPDPDKFAADMRLAKDSGVPPHLLASERTRAAATAIAAAAGHRPESYDVPVVVDGKKTTSKFFPALMQRAEPTAQMLEWRARNRWADALSHDDVAAMVTSSGRLREIYGQAAAAGIGLTREEAKEAATPDNVVPLPLGMKIPEWVPFVGGADRWEGGVVGTAAALANRFVQGVLTTRVGAQRFEQVKPVIGETLERIQEGLAGQAIEQGTFKISDTLPDREQMIKIVEQLRTSPVNAEVDETKKELWIRQQRDAGGGHGTVFDIAAGIPTQMGQNLEALAYGFMGNFAATAIGEAVGPLLGLAAPEIAAAGTIAANAASSYVMWQSMTGGAIDSALEMTYADGTPLDGDDLVNAVGISFAQGVLEFALERVGFDIIAKTTPGLSKIFGDVTPEQIMEMSNSDFVKRFLIEYGGALAGEITTEVLQAPLDSIKEMAVRAMSKHPERFREMGVSDITEPMIDTALHSVTAFALPVLPGAWSTTNRMRRYQRARRTLDQILATSEAADATNDLKINTRDRQAAADFIDTHAKGEDGRPATVYIDPDALVDVYRASRGEDVDAEAAPQAEGGQTFYQNAANVGAEATRREEERGRTLDAIRQDETLYQDFLHFADEHFGVSREQIEDAAELGTDIEMTQGQAVVGMDRTGTRDAMTRRLRAESGGMTVGEAEAWGRQDASAMAESVQRSADAIAELNREQQSAERVTARVLEQLDITRSEGLAMSEEEARGQAALIAAGLTANARIMRRNGAEATAESLMDDLGLTFKYQEVIHKDGSKGVQVVCQRAWQGTPFSGHVGELSVDFIGSGEGGARYGWGLYFSAARRVADWYRKALSGPVNEVVLNSASSGGTYTRDGYSWRSDKTGDFVNDDDILEALNIARAASEHQGVDIVEFLDRYIELGHYRWLQTDDAMSDLGEWMIENVFGEIEYEAPIDIERVQKMRDILAEGYEAKPDGQVHEVELPENDELLDWNKKVAEMPEGVREKVLRMARDLAEADYDTFNPANAGYKEVFSSVEWMTGEDLYDALVKYYRLQHSSHYSTTEVKREASEKLMEYGIPGLTYIGERRLTQDKSGYQCFVIWDDSTVDIVKSYRQEAGDGRAAGSFAPRGENGEGGATITLSADMNATTGIHEMGHFWFWMLENNAARFANDERVQRDWQIVREFVGMEEGVNALSSEQHEKLAAAYTRYLAEGVAPSAELAGVFGRFRRWLADFWRQITASPEMEREYFGGEISDELRGVMDRILATEEQIQAAREEAEFDRARTGVGEDAINSAHARADEAAAARQLVNMRRDLEGAEGELRKRKIDEARERIRGEVESERAWSAIRDLQDGERGVKLSIEEIEARYPSSIWERLPADIEGEGGIALDDAAALFGYDNADQMMDELARAGEVAPEVERRLREWERENLPNRAVGDAMGEMYGDERLDAAVTEGVADRYESDEGLDEKRAQIEEDNRRLEYEEELANQREDASDEAFTLEGFARMIWNNEGDFGRIPINAIIEWFGREATGPEEAARLMKALKERFGERRGARLYDRRDKGIDFDDWAREALAQAYGVDIWNTGGEAKLPFEASGMRPGEVMWRLLTESDSGPVMSALRRQYLEGREDAKREMAQKSAERREQAKRRRMENAVQRMAERDERDAVRAAEREARRAAEMQEAERKREIEERVKREAAAERERLLAAADSIVGEMNAMDVARRREIDRYAQRARNARARYLEAKAAGDRRAAETWKRAELHATAIASAIRSRSEQMRRDLATLKAMRHRKQNAAKNVDQENLRQIDAILDAIHFGDPRLSGQYHGERRSLGEFVARREDDGQTLPIDNRILNGDMWKGDRGFGEYSADDLHAVAEAVRALEANGRVEREVLINGRRRNVENAANALADRIEEGPMKRGVEEPTTEGRPNRDRKRGIMAAIRRAIDQNVRVETLCRMLDGFKLAGPVWEAIYLPIKRAHDREIEILERMHEGFRRLSDEYLGGRGWDEMRAETKFFEGIARAVTFEQWCEHEGIKLTTEARNDQALRNRYLADVKAGKYKAEGTTWTKAEIIMLALNSGNEINIERVITGEGWSNNREMRGGGNITTSWEYNTILAELTEADWKFVQGVWDLLDTMYADAAATHKAVTGLEPNKVQAREFDIRPNGADASSPAIHIKGGYFPIIYDREMNRTVSAIAEAAEHEKLFEGQFATAYTEWGHLKARAESTGFALKLDPSVIAQHIEQAAHDTAYRKAVVDINRLLKQRPLQNAMIRAIGEDAYKQFMPWLVANSHAEWMPTTALDKLMSRARRSMNVAMIGLNPRSMISQTLGWITAAYRFGDLEGWGGYARFLRHMWQQYRNPFRYAEMTQAMFELSPEMRARAEARDRDIGAYIRAQRGEGRWSETQNMFYSMINHMDVFVCRSIWYAGYEYGLEQSGGDERKAVEYADMMVRTTQDQGGTKDMSQLQRLHPNWTSFYNGAATIYNLATEQYWRARCGDVGAAGVAHAMAMLLIVPALIEYVRNGGGGDDEEEGFARTMIDIGQQVMLYPTSLFPVVRDIGGATSSVISGVIAGKQGSQISRDTIVAPPMLRPLAQIPRLAMSAGMDIIRPAIDPDKEVTRSGVVNFARELDSTGGMIFGYPSQQFNRIITAIADLFDEGRDADVLGTIRRALFGGRAPRKEKPKGAAAARAAWARRAAAAKRRQE